MSLYIMGDESPLYWENRRGLILNDFSFMIHGRFLITLMIGVERNTLILR